MKKNNNSKESKKKLLKTKEKPNGGIEVEFQKSVGDTKIGKFFAILISILTIGVPIISLIYILIKYMS